MTEPLDPLLRALGAVERDHERDHPVVWEAVLAGRISPAEAAAQAGDDPSGVHAELQALFTGPIPEQQIAGLVERALAARPVPVSPLRRWRRPLAVTGVILALAAAIVLMIRLPGERAGGPRVAYELTVRNQTVQVQRSDGAPAPVGLYLPDSNLDWVLSPVQAVGGAVELRVLARADDGREQLVAPEFTRSAGGVLMIRGRLDATLKLGPGRWQLRFLVSGPGTDLRDPSAAADALADGTAVEQSDRLEIEVRAADAAPADGVRPPAVPTH